MPFECERCGKVCRDNFDLKRHLARKNPCKQKQKTDTSGNFTFINNNITINMLSRDDMEELSIQIIIDIIKESLKLGGEPFDYLRSLNWITRFHTVLVQNPLNRNVIIKSVKDMTAKVLTENGWKTEHTDQALDLLLKTRSSQFLNLRGQIDSVNPRVLMAPTVQRTMKHVEQLEQRGLDHQGVGTHTRRGQSAFKVAVIGN